MKILRNILVTLLSLVAIICVVALFLPSQQHIERSVVVAADQQTVFETLNSFENFNEWSPWHKLDPNTQYEYSGPNSGVGAAMRWTSENPGVGNGSQEIVESNGSDSIRVRLEFDGQQAYSSYSLASEGNGTRVTWGFEADFGYNLMGRIFGMMIDKILGTTYEEGLNNLKTYLETQPD